MDLPTAAKRYEQGRQFWAREIAEILTKKTHRQLRHILRDLAALGQATSAVGLADHLSSPRGGTRHSQETIAQRIMKDLMEAGLLTRWRESRAYRYALTELGALVLEYLPDEPTDGGRRTTKAVAQPPAFTEVEYHLGGLALGAGVHDRC